MSYGPITTILEAMAMMAIWDFAFNYISAGCAGLRIELLQNSIPVAVACKAEDSLTVQN